MSLYTGWSRVVRGTRADLLDCLQTNLAVIADSWYGENAHLALGADLGFRTDVGPSGAPVVVASLDRRLAEASELLGLHVAQRWDGIDGPRLRDLARERGPLYVVADAYGLGWLPYAGRQHLEHSFLVVGEGSSYLIVDGYHNSTQWGEARPGVWRLTAAELDHAVPTATALVVTAAGRPALDAADVRRAVARSLAEAAPAIDRYVGALRQLFSDPRIVTQLVLDIWLLGRSRGLHVAWLATTGTVPQEALAAAAAHADDWRALTARSYLAMRRAQRGGALPGAVLDELAALLHGDLRLVHGLAPAEDRTPAHHVSQADEPEVRDVVVEELGAVLRVGGADLTGQRPLRALPGFSSFRLVEVIERIEARLGIEVDADELTVDNLQHLDSVHGLFVRAVRKVTQP
jgi:hypothetical protein